MGNFAPDAQQSMLRFERMLARGLAGRGVEVDTVAPFPCMARLARPYRYGGWPKMFGYVDKFLIFPKYLRRKVREFEPDVVHVVDHANASYARGVDLVPALVTCHDLLQIQAARGELPDAPRPGAGGRVMQNWILRNLGGVRHAACVSVKTGEDLRRLTGLSEDRVTVVPNGLNYPYQRRPKPDALASLAGLLSRGGHGEDVLTDTGGFLLNIGGNQWYKNRPGLLAIHSALGRRLNPAPRLVMVGKSPAAAQVAEPFQKRVPGAAVHLGPVTDAELEALYSLAEGLLFPSLAEGFGWPIAEAQACGCAVFTSDRAPMTEVGGDAAVYFDPSNPEGAAVRIAAAWASRESLGEAGRTRSGLWAPELMLERYENLYRRLR